MNFRFKLILGGLLLSANLFLSFAHRYYPCEELAANHIFDVEPYAVCSYWFMLSLKSTPMVYAFVLGVLRINYGWVSYLLAIYGGFYLLDFQLYYHDGLIDDHVAAGVLWCCMVFRTVQLLGADQNND